jgi:hypothetical protein
MARTPNADIPNQEPGSTTTDALFNEFAAIVDAWQNCVVQSIGETVPPGSPTAGQRFIVGASATGAWADHDNEMALYNGGWQFYSPPASGVPIIKNLDDGADWEFVAGVWAVKSGGGIPEAPIDGQEYVRKDAGWVLATGGGGGGGGITLIGSATAGPGGAAALTVGSIPGTYKSLLILLNGRGETAASYIDLFLRCNGDTGANYDFQLNIATVTSPGYGSQHALTAMPAGYVPAASAPAGRSGSVRLEIPHYAGTLFDKQAIGMSGMTFATSNGTSSQVLSGAWRPSTPAAITSISIYASAGDMAEGSELLVFGIG